MMKITSAALSLVVILSVGMISSSFGNAATIPSKVTACWPASSSFCTALQQNTSDAVRVGLSPNICAGVAVFGPRWSGKHKKEDNKKSSVNKKNKKPPVLSSLGAEGLNFPGWSASQKGAIMSTGRYTYDATSAEADDSYSQYDMASCSKIMATTTATAQLYQMGFLNLDDKIASNKLLGPAFASQGKGNITVRNLLLHNAGFPPDPTPYWYSDPLFNCKNNQRYHPVQDFDCVDNIYNDLVYNQQLIYPTGSQYIYSDLSMITLMFVLNKVIAANNLVPLSKYPPVCAGAASSVKNCAFYAYVWNNVFQRYNLESTLYIPDNSLRTPPFWKSDSYRHAQIVGYVSDENAYALGGISGHAGVFSTARDVMRFLSIWMDNQDPAMLNATTAQLFATVGNITQSSRALGWDTNDQPNPPCGTMSKKTFLHEGYTGQMICADPETGMIVALLSGARYPNQHTDGMIKYRPIYTSLAQALLNN